MRGKRRRGKSAGDHLVHKLFGEVVGSRETVKADKGEQAMSDDLNNSRSRQPWVSGPAELLEHADFLLSEDSAVRLRLALIAIDNAVELAIKTYLSLPKRVTKLTIPRKRIEESLKVFQHF